jgi:hypothetical protein
MKEIKYELDKRSFRLQPVNPRLRGHLWLVLTKAPGQKRGEYDEEFDVNAKTQTIAKRIVEQELATNYLPGLRPVRFIWRGHA